MTFWDLHSIVHIPVSDQDPIHFYHASLWDFLMDQHRSRDLYIDISKAHAFLLRMCIQAFTDFHHGSTRERAAIALKYSRCYWGTHYDRLNPGILDKVLEEYDSELWLPSDSSANDTAFILWWKDFLLVWDRFHS